MDEIRISNIERSVNWLNQTYQMTANQDSFVSFDSEESSGWMIWSDASNPDTESPWSWNFNFPNGTGFYEFYSIGKLTDTADETAPSSADAICLYDLKPEISFIQPPTPPDLTETTDTYANVSVSTNDTLFNVSSFIDWANSLVAVSYTHLRAHET